MGINKIICGDCLEVLKRFPPNSIDTIITDPPYGIGFMGKEWDNFKPQKIDEAMVKDKRKHTQIASQRRSNTAGTYDLSLQGKTGFQNWFYEISKEMLRVAKPGATLLCFGGTRTQHRLACAIEDAGWIIKDCIMWIYGSGFPKATDISKQLDKMAGKEREVINKKQHAKKDFKDNLYAQDPANKNNEKVFGYGEEDITKPATSEAKLWSGWKSHGLKPAYEPILMAMKPNEGSYAQNALKYGVAGLNIDEARIGYKKEDAEKAKKKNESFKNAKRECIFSKEGKLMGEFNPQGRFPANIILDGEAAKMLDRQSGESKSIGGNVGVRGNQIYGQYGESIKGQSGLGDIGGASRFFYVAKASREERNRGLEGFPEKEWGRDSLSAGIDRRNTSNVNPTKLTKYKPQNNHPTVKPLKLMEYLCILTKTPTGGIILDPFAGSGTTGMAAKLTKRNYILIEKEKEYCEIAEARIKATPKPLF